MPHSCFHCATPLIWGGDFDGSDVMHDEPSIVSDYHCPKCKAAYRVITPLM